jgi:hypothetical protein
MKEARVPANQPKPSDGNAVDRYIVLERHISDAKHGTWRIAGEVEPPAARAGSGNTQSTASG